MSPRYQGSVPYPAADSAALSRLAGSCSQAATSMDSAANELEQNRSTVMCSIAWTGDAADGFVAAMQRRVDQARRAAASFRTASNALTQQADIIARTSASYDVAAYNEQYLRQNYPQAVAQIRDAMDQQAQNVSVLQQTSVSVQSVIQEAANEFAQMTERARVDAVRPSVQQAIERNRRIDELSFEMPMQDPMGTPLPGGPSRADMLMRVNNGTLTPDPDSRLGAYAATASYPRGSVGYAVHNAIGTIYMTLGTTGEEQIGRVFNSPEARELFDKPLNQRTSRQIAEMEHRYWADVARRNPWSFGGQAGSAFGPRSRDLLQRYIFGKSED